MGIGKGREGKGGADVCREKFPPGPGRTIRTGKILF